MSRDLASGFGLSAEIPIPALPITYFPGLGLIKPLMNDSGGSTGGGATTTLTARATLVTTARVTSTASGSSAGGSCRTMYGQCGGVGWTGARCCSSGSCKFSSDYYSQVSTTSEIVVLRC